VIVGVARRAIAAGVGVLSSRASDRVGVAVNMVVGLGVTSLTRPVSELGWKTDLR
jgi:hypothetical protein